MTEISEEQKQEAYEHFFNIATDKKRVEENFKNLSFKEFTKDASSEEVGCPRGWTKCPGGDCVPPGVLCD